MENIISVSVFVNLFNVSAAVRSFSIHHSVKIIIYLRMKICVETKYLVPFKQMQWAVVVIRSSSDCRVHNSNFLISLMVQYCCLQFIFSFLFPPFFHPSCLSCITYTDENGKDQGINIRQKVKEMVEFAQDDDRLREERKKAKKNKDKYIGVSSDSVGGFRYSEY